jgi:hypothetical protein
MEPAQTSGPSSPRSADEALVVQLLAVISGDAPMADAERLLAPDVISHMDQWTVRGVTVWYDWLDFIRMKAGGNVTAGLVRLVTNGNGTSPRTEICERRTLPLSVDRSITPRIVSSRAGLPRSGQLAAIMR